MTRIISGCLKGRIIKTPKNLKIRPTIDRVKESMFAVLGDISDLDVADLFAGTGNLGFEALSREARSCIFVENSRVAADLIRDNAEILNISDSVEIIITDVLKFLQKECSADLLFADPPYDYNKFDRLLQNLMALKSGTHIVLETRKSFSLDDKYAFSSITVKQTGDTKIHYIEV